jgi:hypothetical protein
MRYVEQIVYFYDEGGNGTRDIAAALFKRSALALRETHEGLFYIM